MQSTAKEPAKAQNSDEGWHLNRSAFPKGASLPLALFLQKILEIIYRNPLTNDEVYDIFLSVVYICLCEVDSLKDNKNLIIVDARVLPSVFSGVLEAKKMLRLGTAKTVGEAAQASGISRSAFYKYKDYVFPVKDMKGILTISFELVDIAGILSEVLRVMAEANCNILTINQNIPVNGIANITISIQNDEDSFRVEDFMEKLERIKGIRNIHVMAKE